MLDIFTGSFEDLVHFIFKVYDFDKDGFISREDVKLILSYLPLREHNLSRSNSFKFEMENFKTRIESQEEIYNLMDNLFEENETINEPQFLKIINEKASETFIYVSSIFFLLFSLLFYSLRVNHFQ